MMEHVIHGFKNEHTLISNKWPDRIEEDEGKTVNKNMSVLGIGYHLFEAF